MFKLVYQLPPSFKPLKLKTVNLWPWTLRPWISCSFLQNILRPWTFLLSLRSQPSQLVISCPVPLEDGTRCVCVGGKWFFAVAAALVKVPGGGRASDEHASDPVSPAGSGEEDVGAIELSLAILPLGPLGEAQGPGGARLVGHRHVGGLGGQEGQFGGDAARAGRAAEEAAELAERQAVHGGAGPGRRGAWGRTGDPGCGTATSRCRWAQAGGRGSGESERQLCGVRAAPSSAPRILLLHLWRWANTRAFVTGHDAMGSGGGCDSL